MKVRINKFVKVDTEVDVLIDQEVDVCMDDVIAGFFQQAVELSHRSEIGQVLISGQLNALVDRITIVLSKIPDARIAYLSNESRQHHMKRLIAQAERFK